VNRFDLIPVCKGSCVLEQQLNAHEEQKASTPELKYAEMQLFFEHDFQIAKLPVYIISSGEYPDYLKAFIPSNYSPSVFHPPAVHA
jgi:hypothetical protein